MHLDKQALEEEVQDQEQPSEDEVCCPPEDRFEFYTFICTVTFIGYSHVGVSCQNAMYRPKQSIAGRLRQPLEEQVRENLCLQVYYCRSH